VYELDEQPFIIVLELVHQGSALGPSGNFMIAASPSAVGREGDVANCRFVETQFADGGLGRTAATEKPGRLQRVDLVSSRFGRADAGWNLSRRCVSGSTVGEYVPPRFIPQCGRSGNDQYI